MEFIFAISGFEWNFIKTVKKVLWWRRKQYLYPTTNRRGVNFLSDSVFVGKVADWLWNEELLNSCFKNFEETKSVTKMMYFSDDVNSTNATYDDYEIAVKVR